MPDMIPASKVAAAALARVRSALASFTTEYDAPDLAHLEAAADLLALIAEPSEIVAPPLGGISPGQVDPRGAPPPSSK